MQKHIHFFLISYFLLSHFTFASKLEQYFSEHDLKDQHAGMQFFQQEILPLDSAAAMQQLNEFTSGADKKAAVATAWKGIYILLKDIQPTDSVTTYLKRAYTLSETDKLYKWRAIFANYLGYSLLIDKNYQKSAEYLLLSDQLMKSIGYSSFYEADLYLYHLARMYLEFSNYEKSIKYLEKALEFSKDGNRTKQFILNLMGISHAELGNYKDAAYFLEKTRKIVVSNNDSSGTAALNGNIGILYARQNLYEKAKPLLLKAYDFNQERANWKSAATNLLWLAEIYIGQNKMDSSRQLLNSAFSYLQKYKVESIESWGLYYRTSSHFYEKKGIYKEAYNYLDSTQNIKNRIIENRDASLLSDVNIRLISDKHSVEIQLLKKEKEHEAFMHNLIIALSLIACLFLLFISYSNYRKRKLENAKFKEEQKKNLAELESFKNQIRSKNKMLEKVKEQMDKIKMLNNEEEKAKNQMAQDLAQSVILTEEDWLKFKILFEKVQPDFLNKVQSEFPDLTAAEIRLLALLKLNLSVSEMANMLGILPESVRKTRQRLMKKLEISYHKELRSFVKEL